MRKRLLACVVVSIFAITGCAPSVAVSEATPSATPTVKPSASASPTPTPRPAEVREVGFSCSIPLPKEYDWERDSYDVVQFSSLQEVWALSPAPRCEPIVLENGPYSTIEYEAVSVAYGPDSISSIDILWSLCVETDGHYQTTGPINDNQRTEAAGALMLCPDHPSAAIMANGSVEQHERDAGVRFADGVREIGAQIQPGTYRASGDIKNCYWARLDASGGTIQNNFIPSATQVEVTIEPSDFSFHVEGCGEFVKIG